MNKRGFTLLEVVMVCGIVAVLATFAMPAYFTARKKAVDNEAKAMLKLLQQAEKVYRLENYWYRDCTNAQDCNTQLRLDLPGSSPWTYTVTKSSATDFCAQAQGTSGTKNWYIDSMSDKAKEGNCP